MCRHSILIFVVLVLLTKSYQQNVGEGNGAPIKEDWLIQPGMKCKVEEEENATKAYWALAKNAPPTLVQNTVSKICRQTGKERFINSIRCVNIPRNSGDEIKEICDCHGETYTWDTVAGSCRIFRHQPCTPTFTLPCVTNAACKDGLCECARDEDCIEEKIQATATRITGSGNIVIIIFGCLLFACFDYYWLPHS